MSDTETQFKNLQKEIAWKAWKAAWNLQTSMGELSALDEKTARSQFDRWWNRRD